MQSDSSRKLPITVGLVGLGYFSKFHQLAWQKIDETRIVAVADRDSARTNEIARMLGVPGFATFEALLDTSDPELIDIVTPPPTHAEFIRRALRPGRTIVCQKPFCMGLDEARAVVKEAEAAGVTLVVHENFRFQPWYRLIKRLIADNFLGPIYQARFALRPGDGRGPDAYLNRQPSFQGMKQFLVRETAVHFLDTFAWLFGRPRSVFADLRQLNPAIAGEDSGILIVRHSGGVVSQFDGNRLVDHAAADRRLTMGELTIEGEKGTLRLDGEGRLFFRKFGGNEEERLSCQFKTDTFGGGSVEALCRHVVNYLLGRGELENTGRQYLEVIALQDAAYRSARSGCVVDLEDGGQRDGPR